MTLKKYIWLSILGLAPLATSVAALEMPGNAQLTLTSGQQNGSVEIAVGPFADGGVPVREEAGNVRTEVWRIPNSALSPRELLTPLREQMVSEGYDLVFECRDFECGGFDFRYEINVSPEPEMHVDLGDFRYLVGRKLAPDAPARYIAILTSRSQANGYVHITKTGMLDPLETSVVASTKSSAPALTAIPQQAGTLAARLVENGATVLDDLIFDPGSASLGADDFGSLRALAGYLQSNPEVVVTLVGHTDNSGSLRNNIELSKKRAHSVLKRLVDTYGISQKQLQAEGVGYLSPRASNLSDEGRTKNRRVEVIITPTP